MNRLYENTEIKTDIVKQYEVICPYCKNSLVNIQPTGTDTILYTHQVHIPHHRLPENFPNNMSVYYWRHDCIHCEKNLYTIEVNEIGSNNLTDTVTREEFLEIKSQTLVKCSSSQTSWYCYYLEQVLHCSESQNFTPIEFPFWLQHFLGPYAATENFEEFAIDVILKCFNIMPVVATSEA